MSISFVAAATPYSSGTSNTATISLTCPSTAQVDDVMLVAVNWGVNGTTNPPATIAGWSLDKADAGSTSVENVGIYTRRVQAGDPGSTFGFTLSTGVSRQGQGQMLVYRGIDATTILDATVVTNKVGSVTGDPVVLDNTSATAGAMAVAFAMPYYTSQATDGTYADPSGWTQRSATTGTGTTARKQMVSYDKTLGAAGTSTGFTLNVTPDPNTWMTQHVILKPAAASGTRVTKTATLSYDLGSRVSEMSWPAFAAHRGGPGAEETADTYDRSYTSNPNFVGEGDMQLLSTGETVLIHDATIDRTADASGTPTTGSVSALTLSQWRTSRVKDLDGTGQSPQPPGELTQLGTRYGGNTATPRVLCLEVKDTGNGAAHAAHLVSLGLVGTTIVNTSTRGDAQAARDAGCEVMFQTNIPNYTNLAADGVKHLSVGSGSITESFCDTAHANGIKVWAYTVNSVSSRDSLLAMGVDGFFTDVPSTIYTGGTRVTKTATASFDVRARVDKAATLAYDALFRSGRTATASYDVRARVTKNSTASYDARQRLARTATLAYDIRQRVTSSSNLTYNVLVRGTKASTLSFDVTGRVTKNGTLAFNVAQRNTKTGSVLYDVQVSGSTRVTKNGTLGFDVLRRGSRTATLTFDIRSRVTKTAVGSYDVKVRVTKNGTISFHVAGRTTKDATLSYNTLSELVSASLGLWFSDGVTMHEIRSVHRE